MKSALVIGYGQIGREIASQLAAAGVQTTIATRSPPPSVPVATAAEIAHIRTDATDPAQLLQAAAGCDVIFACAHAPYDSRQWIQVLPQMEETIMDAAAKLGIPVIFPESVYAYAGLHSPITESSPFAPVDAKGRIRQQLLEARGTHNAGAASVIAGDLIGATAEPKSSVVRLCITDRIRAGRRALVPARLDVEHGITVIADLAAAMIDAAQSLSGETASGHRLLIAPSSNPTLAEIVAFTHDHLGSRALAPISLPKWATRLAGFFDRSRFELYELSPIWYESSVIESGDFAATLTTTRWQEGIVAMLE